MNSNRWSVVLLVLLCAQAFAQTTAEEMRRQRPDFRYLEPGQLRELPQVIRADLEKLGCRVPKFLKWDARHNVIQGQFFKPGQTDWAVLCEAAGRTGIMLYPGGAASELPMLRGEPTSPARTIHVVSAFVLQKRATRDHPDDTAVAFDHDGIEDGPIQTSGRVIYHRDDDWEEF